MFLWKFYLPNNYSKVWNHKMRSYVTQDKYMGRDVRAEEFPSVLASFLYDGERLLAYQIPVLLQKLYSLARIINRLKGYRFYGCSLLFIYDGDRESQKAFKSSTLEHPSSRSKRGESFERSRGRSDGKHDKPALRHSHSEDLLVGPVARRSGGRRKRGEINVRIVDFAHTTTGRDWLPYPPFLDRNTVHEVKSSKGYQAAIDPDTGLIYARFPPHFPSEPDRGFLFGLKNLCETLEEIWNDERIRRMKAARDDASATNKLPPLSTDGKEIFENIFGSPETDDVSGTMST
jgi:inositol-hexakisphosphate 5-kinase